jgi:hypothetical protein
MSRRCIANQKNDVLVMVDCQSCGFGLGFGCGLGYPYHDHDYFTIPAALTKNQTMIKYALLLPPFTKHQKPSTQ